MLSMPCLVYRRDKMAASLRIIRHYRRPQDFDRRRLGPNHFHLEMEALKK